jgi:hypothetical protein
VTGKVMIGQDPDAILEYGCPTCRTLPGAPCIDRAAGRWRYLHHLARRTALALGNAA